ncbi:MAG: 2-dehydro-3-deoxy-6-phosphogalactonate aldolase [Lentisphaeraceae bacterium]|nr:2-dehydro-3-deoxy-6-phosphogalactonate aldolase [Lentisphaeraceae bacterium]
MHKEDFLKPPLIVAIIRGVKPEEAAEVALAMYEGGLRIIEVPLNSPDAIKSIKSIVSALGDKMIVGAGTVLTVDEVKKVKDAGGEIVVSPNINPLVIEETKRLNMLSCPGIMTVTEAIQAIDCGADLLKVFPADVVGLGFIKAAKVILPRKVPMLAVNGVNSSNIQDWLKAGADGFGLGSAVYSPGASPNEISQKCKVIVDLLQKA